MGAKVEEHLSKRLTHIFAISWDVLKQKIDSERLASFKGVSFVSLCSLPVLPPPPPKKERYSSEAVVRGEFK